MSKDLFITVTGFNNYHGLKPFKVNSVLKLVKEPDNAYDDEAIAVEMRYAGKVGFVANSYRRKAKGTMSAGRIYEKILDKDYAQVKFITDSAIIAKVLTIEEQDELRKDPENDINYLDNYDNTNSQ